MKALSDLGKGLDTLSSELQAVPSFIYLLVMLMIVICVIMYSLVIPGLHIASENKRFWRRGCIWTLIIVYMMCVFAITVDRKSVV